MQGGLEFGRGISCSQTITLFFRQKINTVAINDILKQLQLLKKYTFPNGKKP